MARTRRQLGSFFHEARRASGRRRAAGAVWIACAALLGAAFGCAPMSFLITPVPGERALVEHEVRRDSLWAGDKIALIDVDGVLANAAGSSLLGGQRANPVSVFTEKLDQARKDDRVKAVVVRINSPGGGVTASALMHDELRRFRERSGKPVIASMLDVAASGGYYLACAADRILAHATTVTGSIGVIMITPDVSGTMQLIGARANVIKSGAMKDVGSPFRPMNETDRALFQGIIDRMYDQFIAAVARSRTALSEARIRELADGRVYFASQALELGLVDEIGSVYDAINAAKSAAELDDKPIVVVEYAIPVAHRPNVYAQASGGPAPAPAPVLNLELPWPFKDPAPQFLYLWAPGW